MTSLSHQKPPLRQKRRLLLALVLLNLPAAAFAQDCAPGPVCSQTGQKAEGYAARMQARMGTNVLENAKVAWCVYRVTAEVSRVCGDEMAREGRSNCSDLAYQQKTALLENAERAMQNARDSYTDIGSDWESYCND